MSTHTGRFEQKDVDRKAAPLPKKGQFMNYQTCHQLLQQLKSIDTLAISIGESEQLDKEMESQLHDILSFTTEIEQSVMFEAIKAHMQRYLHVYETLENNPQMPEGDKVNGYAELGAELSDLKDLIVKF